MNIPAHDLDLKEVAAVLGVTKTTVFNYLKRNCFPSYMLGRKRLVDKSELINFIKETKKFAVRVDLEAIEKVD